MRISIDTNIFAYALDDNEPIKQRISMQILSSVKKFDCAIGLQVCGELYAVLIRRFKRAPWEAGQAARNIMTAFDVFPASRTAVERALAEAMAGRFSYWDALLLASSCEAGCDYLISEDMSDGARMGPIQVLHPFTDGQISPQVNEILSTAD